MTSVTKMVVALMCGDCRGENAAARNQQHDCAHKQINWINTLEASALVMSGLVVPRG